MSGERILLGVRTSGVAHFYHLPETLITTQRKSAAAHNQRATIFAYGVQGRGKADRVVTARQQQSTVNRRKTDGISDGWRVTIDLNVNSASRGRVRKREREDFKPSV